MAACVIFLSTLLLLNAHVAFLSCCGIYLVCVLPKFKSCAHITCPGLGCHMGHRARGMSQLCLKASWEYIHCPLGITAGSPISALSAPVPPL